MEPNEVNVDCKIVAWALSQVPADKLRLSQNLREKIQDLSGDAVVLTYDDVRRLSKATKVPLGYFFLSEPPSDDHELTMFRTFNNGSIDGPSPKLSKMIDEMERVHEWMIDYRQDFDYDALHFVGSAHDSDDAVAIAEDIRNYLDLEVEWSVSSEVQKYYSKKYTEKGKVESDVESAFNFFRSRLDRCGVVVMKNGVVGRNNHRSLDSAEFRAFAIVDNVAPLIFINSADTMRAQLFSLLHETAHIWLGNSDVFDWSWNTADGICNKEDKSKTEVLCNEVAAELLLPNDSFLREWESCKIYDSEYSINKIAEKFNCSKIVVARRALDNDKISKFEYNSIVQRCVEKAKVDDVAADEKPGHPEYYRTMYGKLSRCFLNALCESIYLGRSSYTEAFYLTNTRYATFFTVIGEFFNNEPENEIFRRIGI